MICISGKHRSLSSSKDTPNEKSYSHSSSSDRDHKKYHKSHHSDKHRSSQGQHQKHDRNKDKKREHSRSSSKTEHDEKPIISSSVGESTDRHGKSSEKKIDKEAKKEMEKKREQKLKNFEEKVNQNYNLKSDKYAAIDMFAPKPLKMPSVPTQRNSITTSPILAPSPAASGPKSPPVFGLKTPPAFGQGLQSALASSSNAFSKDSLHTKKDLEKRKIPSSSTTSSATALSQGQQRQNDKAAALCKESTTNSDRKRVEKIKEQLRREREKSGSANSPTTSPSVTDAEPSEKTRKIFPELPVSKCDGDKLEQHKDDFAATKRRLEEARARKMADIYKQKEMDRYIYLYSSLGSFGNEF